MKFIEFEGSAKVGEPKSEKSARILAAAAAALDGAGGVLPITSLMKAMFYADLVALRDLGATISGAPYVALPAGPVVAGYEKKVIRDLSEVGVADQEVSSASLAKPLRLRGKIAHFGLSEAEVQIARRAGRAAANQTPKAVSDYSHLNPGWKRAHALKVGSDINLHVALQQLDDDDPWVAAPPTDAESEALKARESGDEW